MALGQTHIWDRLNMVDYFLNNDIFGAFYKNQIGVWFESNVTQDEFAFNVILNDFYALNLYNMTWI